MPASFASAGFDTSLRSFLNPRLAGCLQQTQVSPAFGPRSNKARRRQEYLFLGCGTSFILPRLQPATWTF